MTASNRDVATASPPSGSSVPRIRFRREWALVLSGAVLLGLCAPSLATAGGAGRAAARAVAKRLLKRSAPPSTSRGASQRSKLAYDRLRDRTSPVRVLPRERSVARYTTRARAAHERRHGLRPYTHMTASPEKRPLTATQAQRRYGLPRRPEVMLRIRLPKGARVHSNKVVGGKPGYGELTSPDPLPPRLIRKALELR